MVIEARTPHALSLLTGCHYPSARGSSITWHVKCEVIGDCNSGLGGLAGFVTSLVSITIPGAMVLLWFTGSAFSTVL